MTNRANSTTEVFPDKPGPLIRNTVGGERELVNPTWVMPSPPFVRGQTGLRVTNIRNVITALAALADAAIPLRCALDGAL
ncbi:hypothetical protein PZN02_006055 (plasmid) [Sinorhizobium garamanticum]|uniref:Uncharacterized protein n=1 Tax=Sinorhizobium garamanticum TaxID=680247 RepID=A0ABY8DPX2_9HYPH|nr:hypothetical protein [Sinorhizobium garamanticum]WEX91742.1 hypothetical protein PZN02_006055 [Sinorhizobium garamanticum]